MMFTQRRPGLLRGEKRGMDLCLACHDSAFFDDMKDGGISLQQSGHAIAAMAQMTKGTGIDPLSLQCMGCHNNRLDAAGIRVGQNGIRYHTSGAANHPIGVAYPAISKNREIRPKSQLVMPNDSSGLCRQCHIR